MNVLYVSFNSKCGRRPHEFSIALPDRPVGRTACPQPRRLSQRRSIRHLILNLSIHLHTRSALRLHGSHIPFVGGLYRFITTGIPDRKYWPSRAELREKTDMPGLPLARVRAAFMRPFRFGKQKADCDYRCNLQNYRLILDSINSVSENLHRNVTQLGVLRFRRNHRTSPYESLHQSKVLD